MAHFFNYDKGKHSHSVYVFEIENEKGEKVGFRPVVMRHLINGGLSEQISDQYDQLKWKIFSSEKLARDFSIEFFNSLKV